MFGVWLCWSEADEVLHSSFHCFSYWKHTLTYVRVRPWQCIWIQLRNLLFDDFISLTSKPGLGTTKGVIASKEVVAEFRRCIRRALPQAHLPANIDYLFTSLNTRNKLYSTISPSTNLRILSFRLLAWPMPPECNKCRCWENNGDFCCRIDYITRFINSYLGWLLCGILFAGMNFVITPCSAAWQARSWISEATSVLFGDRLWLLIR